MATQLAPVQDLWNCQSKVFFIKPNNVLSTPGFIFIIQSNLRHQVIIYYVKYSVLKRLLKLVQYGPADESSVVTSLLQALLMKRRKKLQLGSLSIFLCHRLYFFSVNKEIFDGQCYKLINSFVQNLVNLIYNTNSCFQWCHPISLTGFQQKKLPVRPVRIYII